MFELFIFAKKNILSFLSGINNIENETFHLIERNSVFLWIPFSIFLICIIILAGVRHYSPNFLIFYLNYYSRPSQLNKLLKEEFNIGSFSSILLIFLFFINSSLMIYLSIEKKVSFINDIYKIFFLLIPIVLYVWNIGTLKFFSWLTSKNKVFNEFIKTVIINNQFIGVIQCILVLFWLFNIKVYNSYINIFIGIQVVMWVFIVFRNVFISLKNSFSWYYIILYLCTLEILPFYLLFIAMNRLGIIKYF